MNRKLQKLKILYSSCRKAFHLLESVEFLLQEQDNNLLSQPDDIRESISEILDLLDCLLAIIEEDLKNQI